MFLYLLVTSKNIGKKYNKKQSYLFAICQRFFLASTYPSYLQEFVYIFSFLLFKALLFFCCCAKTSWPRQCIDRSFFRLTLQRYKAPSWQEAGLAARLGNRNHIFHIKVESYLDFTWGFKSSKSIPRDIHPSSRLYLLNLPEE